MVKNGSTEQVLNSLRQDEQPVEGTIGSGSPIIEQAAQAERIVELADQVSQQLEGGSEISKIAIAQVKTLPTRLEHNFAKITDFIDRAKEQNVELLVFPELTIPGYLSLDNFNRPEFVLENLKVLHRIREYTAGNQMMVVVGFVDQQLDETGKVRYYNAAAVLKNGELLQIVDKTLLPNYDIFWETRYFSAAREREIVKNGANKIGVEICEDLWDKDYPVKVSDELAAQGAEMLVNISASPFQMAKFPTRCELIKEQVKKHQVPFLYANAIGVQDGYEGEIVFDGRSMIFDKEGKLVGLGKSFDEDLIVVDLHHPTPIEIPQFRDEQEVHDALVLGIREYCARNGFKKAYIGVSGGIDSALVAALAVEALGAENVIGVTMPSHVTSEETYADALKLCQNLGIHCEVRSIAKLYEDWEKDALEAHGGHLERITKQNAQARFRGNILMEYTNNDRASLVLSTGNKTEFAVGYCTLYGDMNGGLAVISDVGKLMVYKLSEYINEVHGREVIPVTTITRPPTAELDTNQTDESDLPAPYVVLDPLTSAIIENQLSREELVKDYRPEVVDKVLKLVYGNEYKRRQAPPGIRVTSKAFGSGRRFPLDNKFF